VKIHFKNKAFLDLALTHKSWVNENKGTRESNERIEYLGDAILEFVVSKYLFAKFPDKPEGFLTALRANLVNTRNLSEVAMKLDLGNNLFLSKGEEDGGGRTNPSLLADTVEAVIGALYLDQGLTAVKKFIQANLLVDLDQKLKEPLKDPKSRLQEMIQAKGYPAPKYTVTSEVGPDHDKQFTIQVDAGGIIAQGEGASKAIAQQNAAEAALVKLGENH